MEEMLNMSWQERAWVSKKIDKTIVGSAET